MKRRSIASRRRRGGTFTFIVLAVSVLILTTGTVLVDAVRTTHRHGADQAAQIRLREAAFAGVVWAQRAHARGDALRAGKLRLQAATVEVRYTLAGKTLKVVSLAKSPAQWARLQAVVTPRANGAYGIDTFELDLVDPRKGASKTDAKTGAKTDAPKKTKATRDF